VRRKHWAIRLRRQDEKGHLWMPHPRDELCSEHFHNSDFFWQWGRKLVKPGAEPTIFSFAAPVSRRKPPAERQSSNVGNLQLSVGKLQISASPCCFRGDSEEADHASPDSPQQEPVPGPNISFCASDHSYAIGTSPRILASRMQILAKRLHDRISALRNARKRERRMRGKVGDLLQRLKNLQLLHNKTEELLETYQDIPLDLLSGKRARKYTEDQKQFAITLHYYSPAAYQYVRRRFKLLPCPRTIRGWLRSFDGSPGLTEQSFDTIAGKTAAAGEEAWSYKLCALHMDEMEIKKQVDIERSTGKVYGFTDIGSGVLFVFDLLM